MRSPKRKLSRLAGEKLAVEHGEFPIKVRQIAEQEGIEIHALKNKKPGVSGGIIFTDPPVIFHTSRIQNEGFMRLTIAHELGHYFLDGHEAEIASKGEEHFSRAASGSKEPIEVEADQFAVGLLMPTSKSRKVLENAEMGLAGVEALAEAADVSLIAAALRLIALDPYPVALCSSSGKNVIFFTLSESLRDLGCKNWPRNGDRVPTGSATAAFNADQTNPSRLFSRTCISEWMDAQPIAIDEQVVSQRSYEGRTLTLITGEGLITMLEDDNDEDEVLSASWRASFKR